MEIVKTSAGNEKGREKAQDDAWSHRHESDQDKGKTIQEQVNGNQAASLRSSQKEAGGKRLQNLRN